MRIAVTGTHGCGKTTLIDDFISTHGEYESVLEPYWLLAQNGMPFADGPTTVDLEEQLGQSCTLILEQITGKDVIFDRCPLDFLAYLDVVSADEGFEWLPQGRLLSRIARALATLDVVVFVPLLRPDEIKVPIEHAKLRIRVDQRLKSMLREDDLGLLDDGPRIVEVSGPRAQRVASIAALQG